MASRRILLASVLLLSCGLLAPAQQPAASKSSVVVENPFLTYIREPLVQQELRLTPPQIRALRAATDEVDHRYWVSRDLKLADRVAKTKPLIAHVQQRLRNVLTASQQQRLQQIVYRGQGHRFLLDEGAGRQLRLTSSQRSKLFAAAEDTEKQRTKLMAKLKAGSSRQAIDQEVRDLLQSEQKVFFGVLNPQQTGLLRRLIGDRFDVSRLGNHRIRAPSVPLEGPWINARPMRLTDLRGKVVALHFYAFG